MASGRSSASSPCRVACDLEVDVLGHAGYLHAALQLDLAPFAARLRLAQGLDEGPGLLAEVAEADLHLGEQGLHRRRRRLCGRG